MKKVLLLSCLMMMVMGWYSCTKDTAQAPPAAPVCDSTHVSYNQSVKPLMATFCAYSGCHDGQTAGANDLSNYINVKNERRIDSPNLNAIRCRVQTNTCGNDIMPKGTTRGLRPVWVDTLKLWKAGGYCN